MIKERTGFFPDIMYFDPYTFFGIIWNGLYVSIDIKG